MAASEATKFARKDAEKPFPHHGRAHNGSPESTSRHAEEPFPQHRKGSSVRRKKAFVLAIMYKPLAVNDLPKVLKTAVSASECAPPMNNVRILS